MVSERRLSKRQAEAQKKNKIVPALRRAAMAIASLALPSCGGAMADRLTRIPAEDIVYCDLCGLQEIFDSHSRIFERVGGVSEVETDTAMQRQTGVIRFRITDREAFIRILRSTYEKVPEELSLATSIIVIGRVAQPIRGSDWSPFRDDGRRLEFLPLSEECPGVRIRYSTGSEFRELAVEIGTCLNQLFFNRNPYGGRRDRIEREGSGDPAGYCERY